jgi:hypothetical protein
MKKNIDIDIDYWMKDVELGQIRGGIILYLLDLMDGAYQEREWIEKDKEEYAKNHNKNTRFGANFSFPVELFDDLNLYENIEKKEMPYYHIGRSLKSRREAEKLYYVVYYSDKLMDDARKGHDDLCYRPTNQEYLSSPYLEPMRKAAGEAFKVFMENEKDNKEFCEFIAGLQEERKQQSK